MLNSQKKHASYRNVYDRLKSREITFQQYRKILLKQVFRWVTNIHEHKRYYYTFDNSLLFTEHSEHYTNLSTLIITSGFFRVNTRAFNNAIH